MNVTFQVSTVQSIQRFGRYACTSFKLLYDYKLFDFVFRPHPTSSVNFLPLSENIYLEVYVSKPIESFARDAWEKSKITTFPSRKQSFFIQLCVEPKSRLPLNIKTI